MLVVVVEVIQEVVGTPRRQRHRDRRRHASLDFGRVHPLLCRTLGQLELPSAWTLGVMLHAERDPPVGRGLVRRVGGVVNLRSVAWCDVV